MRNHGHNPLQPEDVHIPDGEALMRADDSCRQVPGSQSFLCRYPLGISAVKPS